LYVDRDATRIGLGAAPDRVFDLAFDFLGEVDA
jgi:hypothetical protein